MVRLSDIPSEEAAHLLSKSCDPFETRPWVAGTALSERRVALLTSAGLHRVGDPAFRAVDLSYRVIPGTTRADELTMTHSSIHFDRTGFREDVNVVFPIDRLRSVDRQEAQFRRCTIFNWPGHVHDPGAERCKSPGKGSSHAFHESTCGSWKVTSRGIEYRQVAVSVFEVRDGKVTRPWDFVDYSVGPEAASR